MGGWIDGWMDGESDEWMNGWIDGWVDGYLGWGDPKATQGRKMVWFSRKVMEVGRWEVIFGGVVSGGFQLLRNLIFSFSNNIFFEFFWSKI